VSTVAYDTTLLSEDDLYLFNEGNVLPGGIYKFHVESLHRGYAVDKAYGSADAAAWHVHGRAHSLHVTVPSLGVLFFRAPHRSVAADDAS